MNIYNICHSSFQTYILNALTDLRKITDIYSPQLTIIKVEYTSLINHPLTAQIAILEAISHERPV